MQGLLAQAAAKASYRETAFPIARLHQVPAWARQLGLAARQRALAKFDERMVIEKTLAVYKELLPGFQKSPDVRRI